MKKRFLCAVLILVLCCSLAVPVLAADAKDEGKANAADIKNKTVTDSLESIDSARWYTFTLNDQADVVIRFTADFAEAGDYWQIIVYKGDELKKSVGVGGGTMGQNDVLLPNHKAGTYYVKVVSRTKGSSGSPAKYYTDTPYTLEVITEGYTHPTGTARRETVSKAGEIVAVIGGKVYIKRNDGQAYVACYVTEDAGKTVSAPMLVGETRDAVEYYTAEFTDKMSSIREMELEGKTYYYTYTRDGYKGVAKDDTLYQCFKGKTITEESAAGDVLKLHFGTSPAEEAQKQESKKGMIGWIIGGVLSLGGVAAVILFVKLALSDKVYVDPEKFSGVGGRTYTEEDNKTLGEMQTIRDINERISDPDYDPAGFPKDN